MKSSEHSHKTLGILTLLSFIVVKLFGFSFCKGETSWKISATGLEHIKGTLKLRKLNGASYQEHAASGLTSTET